MTTPLYHWGTGRRKSAIARVRLRPNGSGKITINKRAFEDYFVRDLDKVQVVAPFKLNGANTLFDVFVNVTGGGMAGQAGAVRLGIARALCAADKERFYPGLKEAGFLTRDARIVERKKPGKKGARASFQFSKR
ncbi:MAG: 30S ribosomal protein S9 [Planctomycetes bacterium]|nr:30S ribosomal protein S9 [Planctomycetota bacterium]